MKSSQRGVSAVMMESGTKPSRSTVKGFLVGLLFGIVLTVIVGVSLYLAEKSKMGNGHDHGCTNEGYKPEFLTACNCWPDVPPDFLASVHLLTPSWSEILDNENSLTFKELVLRTEDVVDNIFRASDLRNFYNHSTVTAFRSQGHGGVVAELQLYFVGGFSARPSELVDAFQFGFATVQQIAQAYVEAVDSTSFTVRVSGHAGNTATNGAVNIPGLSSTPRREIPEYKLKDPDFVATVELVTPSWSSGLDDVNSRAFKDLAVTIEALIDFIFESSNVTTELNYTLVNATRESISGRTMVELELFLISNTHDETKERLESAFQAGYSVLLQTELVDTLKSIDSHTFNVTKFHRPLAAPSPISESVCGVARLYPRAQSGRIIGGTPTDWYGVYPWIVMLLNNGRHLCGATIWDKQHILTAAHCIVGLPHLDNDTILVNSSQLAIIAGKWRYGVDSDWHFSQRVQVVAARMHKDYDASTYNNDIAVLKLVTPLESSQVVEPVCHPDTDEQLPSVGIVAGWGTTREGVFAPPSTLTSVNLTLYDRHDCSRLFQSWFDNGDINRFLHNGTICAAKGLRGGADACQGDSGGPLFADRHDGHYTILGVVTNGFGCGRVAVPGFYTFVPYYLGWIAETINTILKPF